MNTKLQTEEIDFENLSSDELIEYISFKEEFPEEAEKAFTVFCYRFQADTIRTAEIYSNRYNYSEVEALMLQIVLLLVFGNIQNLQLIKPKRKILIKQLKFGFNAIIYNELMKFGVKETCAEADENDLDIIENIDELVTFYSR
jgi:hypothetical protein